MTKPHTISADGVLQFIRHWKGYIFQENCIIVSSTIALYVPWTLNPYGSWWEQRGLHSLSQQAGRMRPSGYSSPPTEQQYCVWPHTGPSGQEPCEKLFCTRSIPKHTGSILKVHSVRFWIVGNEDHEDWFFIVLSEEISFRSLFTKMPVHKKPSVNSTTYN